MAVSSAAAALQYTGIGAFVAIVLYAVIYYARPTSTDGRLTPSRGAGTDVDAATARPGQQQHGGLGPDDVSVLPTFTYHDDVSRGRCGAGGEAKPAADCCAVCLDELGEGALVRMLPSCKHYFHAGCVDAWLLSRATCPVCRASPGPEKVRLGVASLSPPLPQLRRCGLSPKRGETSRAKNAAAMSRSPSPMRPTTTRLDRVVGAVGDVVSVMSPSPTRPRTPESGARWSRSPSPVTTYSHALDV